MDYSTRDAFAGTVASLFFLAGGVTATHRLGARTLVRITITANRERKGRNLHLDNVFNVQPLRTQGVPGSVEQ